MTPPVVGVLMAGGLGTRLWPWSRCERPKQFLPLLGDRSLIRMTWDRMVALTDPENLMVLTNAHLVDLAQEELPEVNRNNLFGEPKSCNTAPCIALAAAVCEKQWGPQAVLVTLASDHYIGDEDGFLSVLRSAVKVAAEGGSLLTIGIPPTRPDTGYGYLECEKKFNEIPEGEAAPLVAFREKPDAEVAVKYLAGGRHLWNMGNFVWRCDAIIAEFERQMPDLIARARKAASSSSPNDPETLQQFYGELPDDLCMSIDFGVMEGAESVLTIPGRIPWDDLGAWLVLRRLRAEEVDDDGNLSTIRHLAIDTKDTLVTGSDSENGVIVTLGVEGLVIVRDGERVLIASQSEIDRMREVVDGIRSKGWEGLL